MRREFVGRSSELNELDAVLKNAAAGRGALTVLSGTSGIGKSRLIREFIETHPDDLIVTAAAHKGEQTPFGVWADVVGALDRKGISVEKCESTQAARERAKNPGADAPPPVDPNENIDDTANRLLELINLSPQPPIIIIEDIQFMDPDSVRLLNHLSFALANESIMILASRTTNLAGETNPPLPPQGIQIELHGLSPTEVETLLKSYFPQASLGEITPIAQAIHRISAGNPSIIVGLIKAFNDELPSEDQLLVRLLIAADDNAKTGNTEAAKTLYLRAAELAEQVGDADALAEAAVRLAFPPDWRTGSTEALGLVKRAQKALDSQNAEESAPKIILNSLQAMLEMRIPQQTVDGRQWAWVTRPAIAQPMSADALDRARQLGDEYALLVALTSWRWTHRAPSFLASRIQISTETLDLAISGDHPDILIEACVRSVVDSLETGDRQAAQKAITIAEWIADSAKDPRIQWRATTLSAALPGLDGNWTRYAELRKKALEHGIEANYPGAFVMDAVFQAQHLIHTLDFSEWEWDNPAYMRIAELHPLSSATWTFGLAHIGQTELASRWLRNTLSILDEESSLIASLTILGFAALKLQDSETATEIIRLLGPWSGRVALDADAGIIVGPVDLALARLCHMVGETDRALSLARSGNELKQQLTGEISNLERLVPAPELLDGPELTDRERSVLQLVGAGMTNKEIAAELRFSLATVRRDTINLYKKLGVRGRAGAVQKASDLGLLKQP